jgi:hypothetical protein
MDNMGMLFVTLFAPAEAGFGFAELRFGRRRRQKPHHTLLCTPKPWRRRALHRDSFLAKVPSRVLGTARCSRRVTVT